ncbi:MAG: RNA methyltransferase [Ardenticatenales bacterium]|nr:RNA methyltransferase [Ardenticatenales bacterium]
MITSAQNPLIKQIRLLQRNRRAREEAGLFLVEGIQGVVEAVQRQAPLETLVYAPERLSSIIASEAIASAQARGVRCEAISAALFESLSSRENPVGILALVARRLHALESLHVAPSSLYVALSEVADPGNLGTVLRTMDAVGAAALLLVGQTVDPFHPTTVKASMGTIFTVPMVPVASLAALSAWCQRASIALIGTSDRAEAPYWSLTYTLPLLLLMGSEAHGLPGEWLSRLPQVARIPMQGSADSLNLGIATALLLYEVRRQQWGEGK